VFTSLTRLVENLTFRTDPFKETSLTLTYSFNVRGRPLMTSQFVGDGIMDFETTVLWYFGTLVLWYFGTLVLWYFGT